MHGNFMKFLYKLSKSKYGRKYKEVVADAYFNFHKHNLRHPNNQKTFVQSLIDTGVFTLDELRPQHSIITRKSLSDFEKVFKKYDRLVKFFIYKYVKAVKNKAAMNYEDIYQDCWCMIWRKADFTQHHKAIVRYIYKIVKSFNIRCGAKSLHIRVPDYTFLKVYNANLKVDENWEFLLKPRNRFVEYLEDVDTRNLQEEQLEKNEDKYAHLKPSLYSILKSLTTKQRVVVSLRFGLFDSEEHTLEQIAKLLNCTRERVRQIEEMVIRLIRQKLLSDSDTYPEEKIVLRQLQLPANHSRSSIFRRYINHHVNKIG